MTKLSVMNDPALAEKRELMKNPPLPEGSAERPYDPEPDLSTESGRLEAAIIDAISEVFDPELPVNVFDLGLIYGIDIDEEKNIAISMTLTAPNCPVAQVLPEEVRETAAKVEGVQSATIDITWDPPWNKGMMSEAAMLEMNL